MRALSTAVLLLFMSVGLLHAQEEIPERLLSGAAWAEAFSTDSAALVALYAEDALLLPYDSPPLRGREAVASRLATGLGGVDVAVNSIRVGRAVGFAFNVGTFEVRRKGQQQIARSGTYTFIFERQPDGTWAIAHHAWAGDAPRSSALHRARKTFNKRAGPGDPRSRLHVDVTE